MKCSNIIIRKSTILATFLCLLVQFIQAQTNSLENTPDISSTGIMEKKRCNFYIFTQDASKKFDFWGSTSLARIWIKSVFLKKKLYVIIAKNSQQVAENIIAILNKNNALIGNIWFDSHGLYRQGYSSFHIGTDEFSYKNIHDADIIASLKKLAIYCDVKTNIGIGSCYGGATFNFPGSANVSPGRMNGDSLMMGMGKIFFGATIYGSESWVMMKPGIYNNNFGFAGYPLGKTYRTTYWKPVWERLGKWNKYNVLLGKLESINTVALNNEGIIKVRSRNYQDLYKGKKSVWKNLLMLKKETEIKQSDE